MYIKLLLKLKLRLFLFTVKITNRLHNEQITQSKLILSKLNAIRCHSMPLDATLYARAHNYCIVTFVNCCGNWNQYYSVYLKISHFCNELCNFQHNEQFSHNCHSEASPWQRQHSKDSTEFQNKLRTKQFKGAAIPIQQWLCIQSNVFCNNLALELWA